MNVGRPVVVSDFDVYGDGAFLFFILLSVLWMWWLGNVREGSGG